MTKKKKGQTEAPLIWQGLLPLQCFYRCLKRSTFPARSCAVLGDMIKGAGKEIKVHIDILLSCVEITMFEALSRSGKGNRVNVPIQVYIVLDCTSILPPIQSDGFVEHLCLLHSSDPGLPVKCHIDSPLLSHNDLSAYTVIMKLIVSLRNNTSSSCSLQTFRSSINLITSVSGLFQDCPLLPQVFPLWYWLTVFLSLLAQYAWLSLPHGPALSSFYVPMLSHSPVDHIP